MAEVTFTFINELNTSLQKGDTIYMEVNGDVAEIGECTEVASNRLSLKAEIPDTNIRPTTSSFLMFGKNNVINNSSLLGYHATVTLTNDSTEFCELFAVNSETKYSSN